MVQTNGKTTRILALDYTKGALVLIMVLYHWLNYFIGPHEFYYRYLRFLTPSFICITGFLISNVYLSKYGLKNPQLFSRLMQRGLKIFGIFVLLNVLRIILMTRSIGSGILSEVLLGKNTFSLYVLGNNWFGAAGKGVAFVILIPISYLLVLSALLMVSSRVYGYTLHVTCLLSLVGFLALELRGFVSPNLELLVIGLLGLMAGLLPIEKVRKIERHPHALLVTYLLYVVVISIWDVIFVLQILGVFLSLMVIFLIGDRDNAPGWSRRQVVLLGKYSLLGYIAQIAILQGLRRISWLSQHGVGVLLASLLLATMLTMMIIESTDFARRKSRLVDGLYRLVFA